MLTEVNDKQHVIIHKLHPDNLIVLTITFCPTCCLSK